MTIASIHTIKMTADQYFALGQDPEGVVKGAYRLEATASGNETAYFPPFPDLPIPLAKLWMPGS